MDIKNKLDSELVKLVDKLAGELPDSTSLKSE